MPGQQASQITPHLYHYGRIISAEYSHRLFNELLRSINWQNSFNAYGRNFLIPRQQAWYADTNVHYRYAENQMKHNHWIKPLSDIKRTVEETCRHSFNSVLITCYRDGNDHVGWHADDEAELGDNPVIASLSLGTSREFCFRHKTDSLSASAVLHDGDLVLMAPGFQRDWEHCVPADPGITQTRINLTFRQVIS